MHTRGYQHLSPLPWGNEPRHSARLTERISWAVVLVGCLTAPFAYIHRATVQRCQFSTAAHTLCAQVRASRSPWLVGFTHTHHHSLTATRIPLRHVPRRPAAGVRPRPGSKYRFAIATTNAAQQGFAGAPFGAVGGFGVQPQQAFAAGVAPGAQAAVPGQAQLASFGAKQVSHFRR